MAIQQNNHEKFHGSQSIRSKELNQTIHRQKCDFLKASSLFSEFTRNQLSFICELAHEKNVEKGDLVILQGSIADALYIVVTGQVLVFHETRDGKSIDIDTSGPGECFGEMAYFMDMERSASVRALEPCSLLQLDYSDIDRILQKVPALSISLTSIISKRLISAHGRFHRTLQKQQYFESTVKSLFDYLDLSDIFSLRNGIEDILERIIHMSSSVMNADRASLFLIDPVSRELWTKVAEKEESIKVRIPMDTGIAGWVVSNDKLINIKDAQKDPRFNKSIDRQTGYVTKSVLCGPVKNFQGEIVGVIQVINKKEGYFTKRDETFFNAFSYQFAIAVENYYLYKDALSNHAKISILLDLAISLAKSLDLKTIFNTINSKTAQILNAEKSTLFLFDSEAEKIWTEPVHNWEKAEVQRSFFKGLAGHVARTGETLNVEDVNKNPVFDRDIDLPITGEVRNLLTTPVLNRNREIIGVIQVINKKKGNFTNEDENFLRSLSAQAGIALENSILHEEILLSFDSSITTLSSVVDARHPLTAGHSERVTKYSIFIAREMGLEKHDIEVLKFAGLLHDIGKIAIRDDILLKNGRFSAKDKVEMEIHPLKTKSILDNFRFPRRLKDVPMVAACHHENIDGTGYPYGLTDTQIPLCSKILAVADVFDALTSKRDYPKYDEEATLSLSPMQISRAVSIMEKESGSHFDSEVVAAFIRCLPLILADTHFREMDLT